MSFHPWPGWDLQNSSVSQVRNVGHADKSHAEIVGDQAKVICSRNFWRDTGAGVNFPSGPKGKCGVGGKTFEGHFEDLTNPIEGHVFPSGAEMGFEKIFHGPKRK